jgi:hypothetical protein
MGKIEGQNSVLGFFHEYLARGRKCSKTTITREEQRMETNPFRVLLVSSGPTYGQNMSLIGESHLGTFPHSTHDYISTYSSLSVLLSSLIPSIMATSSSNPKPSHTFLTNSKGNLSSSSTISSTSGERPRRMSPTEPVKCNLPRLYLLYDSIVEKNSRFVSFRDFFFRDFSFRDFSFRHFFFRD